MITCVCCEMIDDLQQNVTLDWEQIADAVVLWDTQDAIELIHCLALWDISPHCVLERQGEPMPSQVILARTVGPGSLAMAADGTDLGASRMYKSIDVGTAGCGVSTPPWLQHRQVASAWLRRTSEVEVGVSQGWLVGVVSSLMSEGREFCVDPNFCSRRWTRKLFWSPWLGLRPWTRPPCKGRDLFSQWISRFYMLCSD